MQPQWPSALWSREGAHTGVCDIRHFGTVELALEVEVGESGPEARRRVAGYAQMRSVRCGLLACRFPQAPDTDERPQLLVRGSHRFRFYDRLVNRLEEVACRPKIEFTVAASCPVPAQLVVSTGTG
jgi:hypothetical protein